MKSVLVSVAAVALLLSLADSFSSWNDPCTLQPWGTDLTEEGGEVDAPSNCTNGSIWWNYPRGTLVVTFTQQRPFTVCIGDQMGPQLSSIHQTVSGHPVSVDNPAEGEEVCMPHYDTTVQVLLEQPPFQTYMTLYDYRIQFK